MAATPNRNRASIINLAGLVSRIYKNVFPAETKGSVEATDVIAIRDSDGNPYVVSASQLANSVIILVSYTSDNLPDADPAGQLIYISDVGVMAYSNGTEWIS